MSRSDLLTEARDYANRRTGTVPGDLVLRLAIELETVTAERAAAVRDLDAGFAESDHLSAKYYQRMRDAEREMHARELHHFEEEQARAKAEAERDEALAVIAEARALHYEHENTIHTIPATVCAHRYCVDGMGDQVAWPCPTGRILSRIPEHPKED